MKYIVVLLVILTTQISFGKEPFPGVEYSYVKIFLFNVEGAGKGRPDSHIYKNGEYAKTKIGDGVLVSESSVKSFNTLLSGDINTLLVGLSKCFVPRHGLIYYDKNNNPVASVSICFECEQIKLWSSQELRNKIDFDRLSEKSVKKAEKQILLLKKIIKENDISVFSKAVDYIQHVSENENYKHIGEITIKREDTLRELKGQLFSENIKEWINVPNKFIVASETKISRGGNKYEFKTLEYEKESKFIFYDDSENPLLGEAEIVCSCITLPNGVKVGMSLDDIMSTFVLYDGISNPEIIYLESKGLNIAYHFNNHTLIKINLYVFQ